MFKSRHFKIPLVCCLSVLNLAVSAAVINNIIAGLHKHHAHMDPLEVLPAEVFALVLEYLSPAGAVKAGSDEHAVMTGVRALHAACLVSFKWNQAR